MMGGIYTSPRPGQLGESLKSCRAGTTPILQRRRLRLRVPPGHAPEHRAEEAPMGGSAGGESAALGATLCSSGLPPSPHCTPPQPGPLPLPAQAMPLSLLFLPQVAPSAALSPSSSCEHKPLVASTANVQTIDLRSVVTFKEPARVRPCFRHVTQDQFF